MRNHLRTRKQKPLAKDKELQQFIKNAGNQISANPNNIDLIKHYLNTISGFFDQKKADYSQTDEKQQEFFEAMAYSLKNMSEILYNNSSSNNKEVRKLARKLKMVPDGNKAERQRYIHLKKFFDTAARDDRDVSLSDYLQLATLTPQIAIRMPAPFLINLNLHPKQPLKTSKTDPEKAKKHKVAYQETIKELTDTASQKISNLQPNSQHPTKSVRQSCRYSCKPITDYLEKRRSECEESGNMTDFYKELEYVSHYTLPEIGKAVNQIKRMQKIWGTELGELLINDKKYVHGDGIPKIVEFMVPNARQQKIGKSFRTLEDYIDYALKGGGKFPKARRRQIKEIPSPNTEAGPSNPTTSIPVDTPPQTIVGNIAPQEEIQPATPPVIEESQQPNPQTRNPVRTLLRRLFNPSVYKGGGDNQGLYERLLEGGMDGI